MIISHFDIAMHCGYTEISLIYLNIQVPTLIIISLFALENSAHCLKGLQLVSTDYYNS